VDLLELTESVELTGLVEISVVSLDSEADVSDLDLWKLTGLAVISNSL
jgi:hypothetical protein